MKKLWQVMMSVILIPLMASLVGIVLCFWDLSLGTVILVPLAAGGIHWLFRKKLDPVAAAKTNAVAAMLLLIAFTVLMLLSSGNIEGQLMASFDWLTLPFAPLQLILLLMGQRLTLYAAAVLTYALSFAVTAWLGKIHWQKAAVPLALAVICVLTSAHLYRNRPAVRYGGHGFHYMNGYSSTDFTDYTVYALHSKLAALDHVPAFTIDDPADMPVLDGAEACYPLYAALAKAVYRDIDVIEQDWLKETDTPYCNGKFVSFTNTVQGFDRLVFGEADLFFGARPSVKQLQEAKDNGVDLEITPIGTEAFVFFVEADNPVRDLSADQLRAIYGGEITNWKELGGQDQEILAFQRPENSGSQTMMEYFMGENPLQEPQTYEMVDAMAGVIRQVAQYANERGAVGYSFRYFLEELNQEGGVKMLSVDGVSPSLENIENGSYPLVVDVCLITRRDDPNPNVRAMTEFILSPDGQEIVRKTGYGAVR